MGRPRVPIEVDDATGVWSVDGMPMILVPRHFFVDNHLATEGALGGAKYAGLLFEAGHRSAYVWCEQEARTHGLAGVEVFHHYMKRLSQRGWAQFKVESCLDHARGNALLDIACGDGLMTQMFARHFGTVVGVDANGAVLPLCKLFSYETGGAFSTPMLLPL